MAAESSVDYAECQAYVTDRIASGLKEDLVEIEGVQVGTGQASLATEDQEADQEVSEDKTKARPHLFLSNSLHPLRRP